MFVVKSVSNCHVTLVRYFSQFSILFGRYSDFDIQTSDGKQF